MKSKGKVTGVVLAAGEGRRMRPLTGLYPKAMLPVLGIPSFEIVVEKLLRSGTSAVHCNLFHLPDPLLELIAGRDWPLTVHREDELLGTGGGIGNMAGSLPSNGTIILHNGDVVSNIDLEAGVEFHRSRGSLVTMVLAEDGPPRNVFCAPGSEVTSIAPREDAGGRALGYTGIAFLSAEALRFFPKGKRAELVPILTAMIGEQPGSIAGFEPGEGFLWAEIGTPAGYLSLHRRILVERASFDPLLEPPPLPLFLSEGATVDPGTRWRGFLSVERGARVDRDCLLDSCIVLEGTHVPAGAHHANAIIYREGIVGVAE
jgi:NDP-sugar pyrophosphorylase family protein